LVYQFYKITKRGNDKMANTTKTPWWLSLLQVGVSVGMSYLAARENSNAGWVSGGYRDELIAGTAATAINIATQQVTTMQAQAAKTQTPAQ
jgi:hypothetical protein